MSFRDKTVVVTGGSDGVGAAVAAKFAAAGANLLLAARGKKKLEAVAERLRPLTRVEILAMDVADPDACVNLFKKAQFDYGRVDVLVNNAGYHKRGPAASVEAGELGRMVDVNLRAPIVLSRLVLPYLLESGGGAIVNVGSLAGRTPVPNSATYGATKAGLRAFTYAMREELRGNGIKVAIVSPGPIDTGFILDDLDNVSDLTLSQPMSTAEEVAEVVLQLCANRRTERAMPALSGLLTSVSYQFPQLSIWLRPLLERKGARVKRKLKKEGPAQQGG